jgi:transcriptional regulator GlxA family with amidase domain
MYARIVRFKGVLDVVAAGARPEWAEIAAELGFADQPHLVREFHAFAGMSPSAWYLGLGVRRDVGFVQDVAECSA